MEYITRESFNRLRSGMVRQGDIVYCLRGSTIGKTARNHFAEGAIASSLVIVRAKEHCCQEYLYFCLTSPLGQKLVTQHDNGSAQPNLSVRVLSNYVLPLPPLPEQRAIAHILSTLDDKIELNRRMNETLEAIARAIFKSWFVEFDPVRTKMQGRKVLGIGYDIAALFPDTFQDSVLGEIPFGWNSTRLSGQMDILGGGTPKTTQPEYWNGTVPWISVADTAPGPYITRTEKRITNAGVEQSAAQLLPVETIVITARGTVGNTALTAGLMAMNQSCYGLRAKGQMGQLFLLYQVRHQLANLRANTHGSVFETITRSTFDSIEAIQPPDGLLVAYEQLARPLFDRILLNQGENETLVGLRDTLLPKLMSGEIRLSQGKKIVEARA
jgi:type I restriction enzyme S subunit